MRISSRVVVVAALACACLASAPPRAANAQETATELPARIERDTVLDGRYRMTHDVLITEGNTLRIKPGTVIEVSLTDTSGKGYLPGQCELVVEGRILAEGTAEKPIRFLGGVASKNGGNWLGIVLMNDRMRRPSDSLFEHVTITGAWTGIQVSRGRPRIHRCIFFRCAVGVGVGTSYAGKIDKIQVPRGPEPVVSESLFSKCYTGVFVELDGSPHVSRSTFVACRFGLGNRRRGLKYPVRGLGARVERSLFVRNRSAIFGSSAVRSSIFVHNRTVLEFNEFHGKYSQSTDRIAWRANVLHANDVLSSNESDFGSDHLFVDPMLTSLPVDGPLEALHTPMPEVALGPKSPARGRALDGGDPGPTGKSGSGGERRLWTNRPHALRYALALGPASAVRELTEKGKLPALDRIPAPGVRVGQAWWSVLDLSESGAVARERLYWPSDLPLPVVFPFSVTGGGAASLDLNFDGGGDLVLDGKPWRTPETDRRFGKTGLSRDLPPGSATRFVSLLWHATDATARLGLAVLPPTGASAASAIPDVVEPDELSVVPLKFRSRWIGFRFAVPYHWADLTRGGVLTVIDGKGKRFELSDLPFEFTGRAGFVKVPLDDDFEKRGAVLEIDGLRGPTGRVYGSRVVTVRLDGE